jgi:hypothetical protein
MFYVPTGLTRRRQYRRVVIESQPRALEQPSEGPALSGGRENVSAKTGNDHQRPSGFVAAPVAERILGRLKSVTG